MKPSHKLIISVGAGLVLALGVWVYLKKQEAKIRSYYTMTTVITAKRYIAQGNAIKKSWVEKKQIPEAFLQPTALQSWSELEGLGGGPYKAQVGLLKGEQITKSKIYTKNALLGLAWSIPTGQAALSIQLPLSHAVAGLIQPGDWVNILCTLNQQPGVSESKTLHLFNRIRVLAIDNEIWQEGVGGVSKVNRKDMAKEALLITLGLSPREASLLALAQDRGHIRLTLTSPLERQFPKPFVVGLKNLMGR